MIASHADLLAVLSRFNPWWSGAAFPVVPAWKRAAFSPMQAWATAPAGGRALLLSGARQVGKTTLMLQLIRSLLERGVPPSNILYATFDHPLLKLVGLDELLSVWREFAPAAGPALRMDSTAARNVNIRLVPVSESGIGKTFSASISSHRAVRESTQR